MSTHLDVLSFLLDSPRFHSPSSYPVLLAPDEVTVPRAEGPRPGCWTEGREQETRILYAVGWRAEQMVRWQEGTASWRQPQSYRPTDDCMALTVTIECGVAHGSLLAASALGPRQLASQPPLGGLTDSRAKHTRGLHRETFISLSYTPPLSRAGLGARRSPAAQAHCLVAHLHHVAFPPTFKMALRLHIPANRAKDKGQISVCPCEEFRNRHFLFNW